jgi:activating signal cointegrator complex subunit 3
VQLHAPVKPVLVFVSSRRQTRLTALDLIAYAAADERPSQFVHMPEPELEQALMGVQARGPRPQCDRVVGFYGYTTGI